MRQSLRQSRPKSLKPRSFGRGFLFRRLVFDSHGALAEIPAKVETMEKLRRALESAGVEFIEENGGGPGVRLREGKSK